MNQNKSDKLYSSKTITIDAREENRNIGRIGISEMDRLIAAKQILLGLAILFALTIVSYLIRPEQGNILLEICKTTFPPLVTLIIAFYFKEKSL